MKVRLDGKYWGVRYVKDLEDYGDIDAPHVKGKEIRLRADMKMSDELDTIIHECLHGAGYKQFSEEWVTETAKGIASLLIRMGWRNGVSHCDRCGADTESPDIYIASGI